MRIAFLGGPVAAALLLAGLHGLGHAGHDGPYRPERGKEVPANDSPAGMAMVTIDKAAKTVSWSIDYPG